MITIFMYHQVAELPREADPRRQAVPPAQFERQMRYLASHGYSCLGLPEVVERLRSGRPVPARSFVLTFDDGYQNFSTSACPILEQYGFTATVFLVAGRMGAKSDWWGQDGASSGLLLTWDEARDLARRGYTLGSHSFSHRFLNRMDERSAFDEIERSRALLKDRLDVQVDFFSYPFSQTNSRVAELVAAAGYKAACAGEMGPWGLFNLWRVECLGSDSNLAFALKAGGWYNKKTALRESAPGRFSRGCVHLFRRWLHIRRSNRPDLARPDPGMEVERKA